MGDIEGFVHDVRIIVLTCPSSPHRLGSCLAERARDFPIGCEVMHCSNVASFRCSSHWQKLCECESMVW